MTHTNFSLFAQALLVGLLIAAPVGAIGLLTIHRTLDQGLAAGLATGLGAAAADAVYGSLGALGVNSVILGLVGAQNALALAGGAVLLWLAWRTYHQPPAKQAAALPLRAQLLRCFAGTFALTLSNPATILSFIAVFATLAGARGEGGPVWPMVAGVAAGSALWWLLLCGFVSLWRHRFDERRRRLLNRGSALLLAGFALVQWAGVWARAV
jgi:threonine/homoserine/homoserine lactone efflux protein